MVVPLTSDFIRAVTVSKLKVALVLVQKPHIVYVTHISNISLLILMFVCVSLYIWVRWDSLSCLAYDYISIAYIQYLDDFLDEVVTT